MSNVEHLSKTWADYDPTKLSHVVHTGSSPVDESSLRKGDILIATESGCMDLVEVLENKCTRDTKHLLLLYHTSFGEPSSPTPFTYEFSRKDNGQSYVGLYLRVFDKVHTPARYLVQASEVLNM